MLTYVGVPKGSDYLEHYGRLGMKWGQHIFGDDPRWGKNGRGSNKNAHTGEVVKTPLGKYDTDKKATKHWSYDERRREWYYAERDKRLPLSKLKRSSDKLSNPPTLDELKNLAKKVNPGRNDPRAAAKGYESNCVKCAVSTLLRLRGYDAVAYAQENNIGHICTKEAQFYSHNKAVNVVGCPGTTVSFPKTKFPTKYYANKEKGNSIRALYKASADALNNTLKDGDYGFVSSYDDRGDGHACNFVKTGGKTYIVDGQAGTVENVEDYYDSMGWWTNNHQIVICTNATLNEIGVGRFVDENQFKK